MVVQELMAKPKERKEALYYDKFSVGVFNPKEEKNKMNTHDDLALVSDVPTEISSLPYYFLKADKDNTIYVKVTGANNREVGLIVRTREVISKKKNPPTERILDEVLQKKKGMF